MSTVLSSKVAYAGIGFLLTLISGVVLSKMGRPLNSAVFGAHKIIAVGTIVLIGLNIRDLAQVVGLQAVHPALIWGTGLLLLVLVVTMSCLVLSSGKDLNGWVKVVQKVSGNHYR